MTDMNKYKSLSILAENLKSFGPGIQGFESIKTVNLIVGRNNSGKSSLIDLIDQVTRQHIKISSALWHQSTPSAIYSRTLFSQEDANFFPTSVSGGIIPGVHHVYGKKFIGATITTKLLRQNENVFVSIDSPENYPAIPPNLGYFDSVVQNQRRNPLSEKAFHRLAAERNIVPEKDLPNISIGMTGDGATNLIQHFINKSNRSSALVEKDLLNALNTIFAPDATFTDIVCQQHENAEWEIYLDEEGKGRISLSNSGSGLKTIILALCYIHLIPAVAQRPLHDFVFAFEELENNLHPALQRRLLVYLLEQARRNHFIIFLTTHSSVAIDLFNKEPDAQIIHVTHNRKVASCKVASAHIDNRGILDDLDVRASDLLQSNGIIWVEGPSDRVYITRWIATWTDGELIEGNQYQCVFYGGRLLSHLTGQCPEDGSSAVSILVINRNAAILIDSDRRVATDPLNSTKRRLVSEFEAFGGMAWVTDGREIENYVPTTVVMNWINPAVRRRVTRNPYDNFFSYMNRIEKGVGDKFSNKKPVLAELFCNITTKEHLQEVPALAAQLEKLCARIRSWNNMS